MSADTIQVGQTWADLDMRNAKMKKVGGAVKPRTVEIVSLPTASRKGVMRVTAAPHNEKSVGQLREFTREKLLAHYALVRQPEGVKR